MKTPRSVLSALLAATALSALAFSATPAQACGAKAEGTKAGEMRSDGTTTERDSRSAGDRVSDQALETKVKSALIGDDRVKARNIEVEVRNGVVNLAGSVDYPAEAQAAVATARQVSGVTTVNSALTVGAAQ